LFEGYFLLGGIKYAYLHLFIINSSVSSLGIYLTPQQIIGSGIHVNVTIIT